MVSEDDYYSMKLKLPKIKRLLDEEQYIRCVTYGEHLLLRYHEKIHPIHLLYIHFYLAMAHDTMAREATRARRCFELNRAEKHYLLAIASLNSQISDAVPLPYYHRPASPTVSDHDYDRRSRRTSDASHRSLASSATSISEGFHETAFKEPFHQYTTALTPSSSLYSPPVQTFPEAPITSHSTLSDLQWVFLADLSYFRGVISDHLREIVELKQAMLPPAAQPPHTTHTRAQSHTYPHSRNQSIMTFIPKTAIHTRAQSVPINENNLRSMPRFANRRGIPSRPKFDPTSVQKLCNEVLFELRR